MCWPILSALIIVLMLIIWIAVGLQGKIDVVEIDSYRLKLQLRSCEEQRIMDSVRFKSSEFKKGVPDYHVEEL